MSQILATRFPDFQMAHNSRAIGPLYDPGNRDLQDIQAMASEMENLRLTGEPSLSHVGFCVKGSYHWGSRSSQEITLQPGKEKTKARERSSNSGIFCDDGVSQMDAKASPSASDKAAPN